ncbi:MAG: hypothetical protein AB8B73_06935 [Ekhidna sp.]
MKILATLLLTSSLCVLQAQETEIAKTIDALTVKWDKNAIALESYDGLGKFCSNSSYRKEIISLLDEIHHYDTLLYGIVNRKFDANEDEEAKATIDDINTLESEYTTQAFKKFIHQECNSYNEIEKNLGSAKGKKYEKEVSKLEKELIVYVEEVTKRIDLIDEHMHHLHIGE